MILDEDKGELFPGYVKRRSDLDDALRELGRIGEFPDSQKARTDFINRNGRRLTRYGGTMWLAPTGVGVLVAYFMLRYAGANPNLLSLNSLSITTISVAMSSLGIYSIYKYFSNSRNMDNIIEVGTNLRRERMGVNLEKEVQSGGGFVGLDDIDLT